MKELEVKEITNKKGATIGYRTTAVSYKAANKESTGKIGLSLEYNNHSDKLYAIVKGIRVYITETPEGLCKINNNYAKEGYAMECDNKLVRDITSSNNEIIYTYLCSRYNLTNRKYSFLVSLAIEGKALLTKAEMKEQLEALIENR